MYTKKNKIAVEKMRANGYLIAYKEAVNANNDLAAKYYNKLYCDLMNQIKEMERQ